MTDRWQVQLSPRSAKLYWSWEYGLQRAINLWRAHGGASGLNAKAWLKLNSWSTKRAADAWANRVRSSVAYQEGKLGKPLTGGDIYVERAD